MIAHGTLKHAQDAGPAFSLLIATLNRVDPLRRLFESLAAQTCRDFEVLIADQNPPGFLDDVYSAFPALPLRVIPVPSRGVSAARNALLPYIRGNFVAFPDDDCWYAPDTLEQARMFFAANPHAHAVLGRWYAPAGSSRPRPQASGRLVSRFSTFKSAGTLVHFYRRAVVDAVGDFDPELGPGTGLPYGCGEDTDYILRAQTAGFTVVCAPNVQVHHPEVSFAPFRTEKIKAYAQGRMHLLRKHRFPLWFTLVNIFYPLCCLLFEGPQAWTYRTTMFLGRLYAFCQQHAVRKNFDSR